MIYAAVASMIDTLDSTKRDARIIRWSCPVPVFGDIETSRLATVGLNPSMREFIDTNGNELSGAMRRFPTLRSLKLGRWSDANAVHIRRITEACRDYFRGNPYNRWFKRLDAVIAGTGQSFYSNTACHLDLVPYATLPKWNELTASNRSMLLKSSEGTLGRMIRDSAIDVLVLNGASVADYFVRITGAELCEVRADAWTLNRASGRNVSGVAYTGAMTRVGRIHLNRTVTILGFNHNIQSSFGVTARAVDGIAEWLQQRVGHLR